MAKKSLPWDTGHCFPPVPAQGGSFALGCQSLLPGPMIPGQGIAAVQASGFPGWALLPLAARCPTTHSPGSVERACPTIAQTMVPASWRASWALHFTRQASRLLQSPQGAPRPASLPEVSLGQSCSEPPGSSPCWGAIATPQAQPFQLFPKQEKCRLLEETSYRRRHTPSLLPAHRGTAGPWDGPSPALHAFDYKDRTWVRPQRLSRASQTLAWSGGVCVLTASPGEAPSFACEGRIMHSTILSPRTCE